MQNKALSTGQLWSGTGALHTLTGPASAPASAVRHVGAFLRRRCGTLEDAFSALDSKNVGAITLESFARSMEQLGYDSPLAETTRVFQAMDPGSTGSVGLQTFLVVLTEDAEEPRRYRGALTSGPDSGGGLAARSTDGKDIELAGKVAQLEARLEGEVAKVREFCERASVRHAELLEGRCLDVERETMRKVEQLEAKCLDIERVNVRHAELLEAKYIDAERANSRQAELLETKYMNLELAVARQAELLETQDVEQAIARKCEQLELKCRQWVIDANEPLEATAEACITGMKSVSDEFKHKVEAIQQHIELRLRDAELVAQQHELEIRTVAAKLDSNTSTDRGDLLSVQREVKDSLDLMRSSVEGTMQAFRGEMRAAIEQERTSGTERTRALARALSEEFERSILAQAIACARSEAMTMASGVFAKEIEIWHKEKESSLRNVHSELVGNIHCELAQLAERLSLTEDRMKSLAVPELQAAPLLYPEEEEASKFADDVRRANAAAEARVRAEVTLEARIRADAKEAELKIRAAKEAESRLRKHVAAPSEKGSDKGSMGERGSEADAGGSDKPLVHMGPGGQARLEHTLQAIIEKLDSQCIDGLAPDLKELNSLLRTDKKIEAGALMNSTSSAPSMRGAPRDTSTGRHSDATSSTAVRRGSPDSSAMWDVAARTAEETQSGEIKKLREDILGYLKCDFQEMVSTTLKDLKKTEERGVSSEIPAAHTEPARPGIERLISSGPGGNRGTHLVSPQQNLRPTLSVMSRGAAHTQSPTPQSRHLTQGAMARASIGAQAAHSGPGGGTQSTGPTMRQHGLAGPKPRGTLIGADDKTGADRSASTGHAPSMTPLFPNDLSRKPGGSVSVKVPGLSQSAIAAGGSLTVKVPNGQDLSQSTPDVLLGSPRMGMRQQLATPSHSGRLGSVQVGSVRATVAGAANRAGTEMSRPSAQAHQSISATSRSASMAAPSLQSGYRN